MPEPVAYSTLVELGGLSLAARRLGEEANEIAHRIDEILDGMIGPVSLEHPFWRDFGDDVERLEEGDDA